MIPMQYKAIIGVSVVAFACIIAYGYGRESGLEIYHDYKADVEAANAVLAEKNAERLRIAEENTLQVAERYAAHAGNIERNYISRLRNAKRNCAGVPAATGASEGIDAAAKEPASGASSYEAICEQTERDAASDALKLIWLQDYVTRVCK